MRLCPAHVFAVERMGAKLRHYVLIILSENEYYSILLWIVCEEKKNKYFSVVEWQNDDRCCITREFPTNKRQSKAGSFPFRWQTTVRLSHRCFACGKRLNPVCLSASRKAFRWQCGRLLRRVITGKSTIQRDIERSSIFIIRVSRLMGITKWRTWKYILLCRSGRYIGPI